MTINELPESLANTVRAELEADEKIEWLSQPVPNQFAKMGIPFTIFGVIWTGAIVLCAIWWNSINKDGEEPNLFRIVPLLLDIPFLLVGICLLCAPLWMKRTAYRTAYVITNHRVILFEQWWSMKIRSFQPDAIKQFVRKEFSDGVGDLIFSSEQFRDSDGATRTKEIGFRAIPEVPEAERILRRFASQNGS